MDLAYSLSGMTWGCVAAAMHRGIGEKEQGMRKMWICVGLSLVLGLVGFVGLAEPAAEDWATASATAARGLAETYVEGMMRTMVVLAATAPVKAGYWDGMFSLLDTFQGASLPMATWFVLPDGSYHTVSGGKSSANLSDRTNFPVVMSGQIATGYVVVSRSTGRVSMVTAVPVSDGGEVVGALGTSLFLDAFSVALAEDLALPNGYAFFAATADGTIAMHADPEKINEAVSEAGVAADGAEGVDSTLLGWSFVVGPVE